MKRRYLTSCTDAGHAPTQGAGALTLRKDYAASVVLTGPGVALGFSTLPTEVLMSAAQMLVGPTGDKASISADRPNALRQGLDGKLLVDDVTGTNCTTDFSTIYQLSK